MRSRQYNCDFDYRKRQIDTLKIFNDNVREITENELYGIQFESAGRIFQLHVQLGPGFPNEKPKISITPRIWHPWVNPNGTDVEDAPGLLNYSVYSDLGRVVHVIIRAFEKCPPPLLIPSELNPNSIADKMKDCLHIDRSSLIPKSEPYLPKLSSMSLDELKKLDSDPEFFEDFIEELSVVQHLNDELDSMITQVESIAQANESRETNLNELKQKLKSDVQVLQDLGHKCEELNKKYLRKAEEFAPQHIRELLQIAASNSDAECEKHIELFLNGKIDVKTFLNQYTHSKKISSQRKAKEERLGHQLAVLGRCGF